jgi:two-component system phosphate regulon sensor histidine kinase PhoR
VPRARGLWDFVFSDLNRRARLGEAQRQRLSSSLEQFRDASQAMPDGVAYLSANNGIEWVNQQAERQFGLDAKRDLGAPITNLVREPDFVAYLQGGNYSQPLVFHSRRNSQSALLVQVIPYGEGQKLILSRDITQLQRLENMRRDFVANVSHELRTPLTVIRGFLETMEDGLEEYGPAEMRHFLTLTTEQASRMQRLIEDLLSLSALETGAPEPVEEDIRVGDLLEDVRDEALLLSAGRHRIDLEMGRDALLRGSRKELYSAFANLAANAVRYTPEGGSIVLAWRWDPGGGRFSVQDTGIGIAAAHIPRLTERFYRVDRGRSRESGGTGLGLAIVKHVLSRHQADLLIESTPGQGSRFTVRLPARRLRALTSPAPVRAGA